MLPWDLQIVRLADLPAIAGDLAEQVRLSGFEPEHIIYLERAGRLPGYLLQARFGGSISAIRISRPGGKFKALLSPVFPLLPRPVIKWIRHLDLLRCRRRPARELAATITLPPCSGSILIVDDALDSGYSMKAAVDCLLQAGYRREQFRIAVINTTLSGRIIEPDYVIFHNTEITFPWSGDSIERRCYLELYEKCGQGVVDLESLACP